MVCHTRKKTHTNTYTDRQTHTLTHTHMHTQTHTHTHVGAEHHRGFLEQDGLLVKWSTSPNDFQLILVFACRICNCVIRINSNCTLLNSVCQLVAHIHVFLVHAVITLQPLQQQLYFHNKKFDGQVFLVQKRHNADNMCPWVPASESMRAGS